MFNFRVFFHYTFFSICHFPTGNRFPCKTVRLFSGFRSGFLVPSQPILPSPPRLLLRRLPAEPAARHLPRANGSAVPGSGRFGVVPQLQPTVVAAVPAVQWRVARVPAVPPVQAAVRVRPPVRQRPTFDFRLGGDGHAVAVQVPERRFAVAAAAGRRRVRPPEVLRRAGTARTLPDGVHEERVRVPVAPMRARGPRRHHRRALRGGARSVRQARANRHRRRRRRFAWLPPVRGRVQDIVTERVSCVNARAPVSLCSPS